MDFNFTSRRYGKQQILAQNLLEMLKQGEEVFVAATTKYDLKNLHSHIKNEINVDYKIKYRSLEIIGATFYKKSQI